MAIGKKNGEMVTYEEIASCKYTSKVYIYKILNFCIDSMIMSEKCNSFLGGGRNTKVGQCIIICVPDCYERCGVQRCIDYSSE